MKCVLATLNAKYSHSSLALRYLRNALQADGQTVEIREYTINQAVLDIVSDLYRTEVAVIGFACYIWNMEMTCRIATLLKKVCPTVTIILGGPEVSYEVEAVFDACPAVDYIVQGEGEAILPALLNALQQKPAVVEGISGLSYRRSDGSILIGQAQVVEPLAAIPFPYTDEDMALLKDKIIYYETTRGCPFSCQYCLSSATQGVRFLPLERVMAELAFFVKHDVRQVKFVDRTFNARKSHYLPILQFLAQQECRTNFHFEIAADILDEDVVAFLADVPQGRFQFEIGIQSTAPRTLEAICRNNHWDKIKQYVGQILGYGNIHLHLDLIVGLPHETYARFAQSFNDVYALQPDMLQIGFLKLLKGSGIRRKANEYRYVFDEQAPYEVLANQDISYAEVRFLKILEDVFEQTYNSGRFKQTLAFLIQLTGGQAFAFYESFTAYWEKQGWHQLAHSAKSVYRYLALFVAAHYPEQQESCQLFLKLDALTADKGNVRPDFLTWNETNWNEEKTAFWRDEAKVQRYLPAYVFTNWRDLKKRYHIEVLNWTCAAVPSGIPGLQQGLNAVLFDYSGQETKIHCLAAADFFS